MFVLSHKKTAFNHFLMLYDGSIVDDFKLDLIKSPPAITEKFSSYLITKIDLLIIKIYNDFRVEWWGCKFDQQCHAQCALSLSLI